MEWKKQQNKPSKTRKQSKAKMTRKVQSKDRMNETIKEAADGGQNHLH